MQFAPLIELSRAGLTECLHFGAIAVVNRHGKLLAQVGDPHWCTYTRSTLKALQALPFVNAHGPERAGFSQAEVAMLCASHNGEEMHVQATESMLDKVGLNYRALRCGCHVPGLFTLMEQLPPADLKFDERHHNCSGKHAGFLAHCVQQGWSLDDYTEPHHPLQKAIREADAQFGASFAQLATAMTECPEWVSGTGRNDLAFMQAGRGDWVSKIGADGVQVVASKSRGEAFAIKIIDANKPALFAASVEALDQLGWLDAAQRSLLAPWRASSLNNAKGTQVGARTPLFKLQTH